MSHFPAGQVRSTTPGWPGTKITQGVALGSSRVTLASYSANVNMTVSGAHVIFTTDADKGRFFPILITAYCTAGNQPGGLYPPAVSIGWNPGNTQPYIDWVNQEGIAGITALGYGPGNYQVPADFPIGYTIYNASAPPSTNVVVYVFNTSGASIDTRTFVIWGFYTGG